MSPKDKIKHGIAEAALAVAALASAGTATAQNNQPPARTLKESAEQLEKLASVPVTKQQVEACQREEDKAKREGGAQPNNSVGSAVGGVVGSILGGRIPGGWNVQQEAARAGQQIGGSLGGKGGYEENRVMDSCVVDAKLANQKNAANASRYGNVVDGSTGQPVGGQSVGGQPVGGQPAQGGDATNDGYNLPNASFRSAQRYAPGYRWMGDSKLAIRGSGQDGNLYIPFEHTPDAANRFHTELKMIPVRVVPGTGVVDKNVVLEGPKKQLLIFDMNEGTVTPTKTIHNAFLQANGAPPFTASVGAGQGR